MQVYMQTCLDIPSTTPQFFVRTYRVLSPSVLPFVSVGRIRLASPPSTCLPSAGQFRAYELLAICSTRALLAAVSPGTSPTPSQFPLPGTDLLRTILPGFSYGNCLVFSVHFCWPFLVYFILPVTVVNLWGTNTIGSAGNCTYAPMKTLILYDKFLLGSLGSCPRT